MTVEKLKETLEKHKKWLLNGPDGQQADLSGADLSGADLSGADLSGADLSGADLRGADLRGADLSGADLSGADLSGIQISERTIGINIACPEEGSFIGYKKASGKIVVLEIPAEAKRSSATTLKCRCSKAKVIRIENLDESISEEKSVRSDYDPQFVYTVGEMVRADKFDANRWQECSTGIHFFINKEVARQYCC